MCLQETHSTSDAELLAWFNGSPFSVIGTHGTNHSAGVCILFKSTFTLTNHIASHSGRVIVADFTSNFHAFRVVCVYAPNQYLVRGPFFQDLYQFSTIAHPVFLFGDFNAVFDRSLDRTSSEIDFVHRDTSIQLHDLFGHFDVVDIWRSLHPAMKRFTWTRPDGSWSSRIDLIGVPQVWSYFAISCDIVPCPYSDHYAVSLCINIPSPVERGPSFWKLNVSLLEDEEYCTVITIFLRRWILRKPLLRIYLFGGTEERHGSSLFLFLTLLPRLKKSVGKDQNLKNAVLL